MQRPRVDDQIVFLRTNDMAATTHFYEEVMGLPLVVDQGHCRIYRVSSDGYIGFCTKADSPAKPAGVCFTIVTADVDGWHQYLVAKGVAFEKTPVYDPKDNIYHCTLRDPNGYLVEFQRFSDAAWDRPQTASAASSDSN